jgi:hypothetical protein
MLTDDVRGVSRMMVHDLKQQERMHCVRGFRATREDANLSSSFRVGDGVTDVRLQARHGRDTRWVCIVNQHGGVKVPLRKHADDVGQVNPNLLDAGLVVLVVRLDDDLAAVFEKPKMMCGQVVRKPITWSPRCATPSCRAA